MGDQYSRRNFGYVLGGLATAIFGATVIVPRTKLLDSLEKTTFDGVIDGERVVHRESSINSGSYMKIYSADGKLEKRIFNAAFGDCNVIGDSFFDKYEIFTSKGVAMYTNHSQSKYGKITWGKTAEAEEKLTEATQIFNDKINKMKNYF